MGDDPLLSKPMTAAEFAAIMATKPFTKLQRPGSWWLDHSFVTIDSAGTPHFAVDTSGRFTEASAATISASVAGGATGYIAAGLEALQGASPRFSTLGISTITGALAAEHRIAVVPFTSDGAGAVAFQAVVPALAGYTGHCKWLGTWFDTTDAALTITWSVAAGTILGPAVHAIACTANCVTQAGAVAANQVGMPIPLRGTIAADDNKNLGFAIAGYGNTNNGYVIAEYWYET